MKTPPSAGFFMPEGKHFYQKVLTNSFTFR